MGTPPAMARDPVLPPWDNSAANRRCGSWTRAANRAKPSMWSSSAIEAWNGVIHPPGRRCLRTHEDQCRSAPSPGLKCTICRSVMNPSVVAWLSPIGHVVVRCLGAIVPIRPGVSSGRNSVALDGCVQSVSPC